MYNDPLFSLEELQNDKPLPLYTNQEESGVYYPTDADVEAYMGANEDSAWVQILKEEGQIWGRSVWD